MNRPITAAIVLMLLTCLVCTLISAIAPFLSMITLVVVAIWMLVRRPFLYPWRLTGDLEWLGRRISRGARRLVDATGMSGSRYRKW